MDAKMNIPRNFHNRSPQSIRRGPPLEDDDEEDDEVVDEEFDALNVSIIIVITIRKAKQSSAAGSLRFYKSQKSIKQTLLIWCIK